MDLNHISERDVNIMENHLRTYNLQPFVSAFCFYDMREQFTVRGSNLLSFFGFLKIVSIV